MIGEPVFMREPSCRSRCCPGVGRVEFRSGQRLVI